MSSLRLSCDPTAVRPGESLRVQVDWDLTERPEKLVVNLLWYTSGKGDEDIQVVDGETVVDPGTSGSREITFTAPAHPPSFSGRLITLTWAVEALIDPGKLVERRELVIAPEARELILPRPEEPR